MALTTPTYGGSAIFGRSVRMRTVNDPSAEQVNKFFGLDGLERIHGGLSGRVTLAEGLLFHATPAGLGTLREGLRALDDGVARVLVDTIGVSWPFVVLRQFEPGERILRDGRGVYLPYRVVLRHLG